MTVVVESCSPPDGLPPTAVSSLSPSRAADFRACPLLYRFRTIDRLPEQPDGASTRGTLVHAVLEALFDLPAVHRTPDAAADMVRPQWSRLLAAEPRLRALFVEGAEDESAWLSSAEDLLRAYFTLEDPRRLEPADREACVQTVLESGLCLRGYVDRLDEAPSGELRVVDYKTGTSPDELFESRALFQMKFYALVLWRSRGRVPSELRLLYLGDRAILRYSPDEMELRAFQRSLEALWTAIERAVRTGDWRPSPSRLCDWCDHKALCPAFGGTPPPLPDSIVAGNGHTGRANTTTLSV